MAFSRALKSKSPSSSPASLCVWKQTYSIKHTCNHDLAYLLTWHNTEHAVLPYTTCADGHIHTHWHTLEKINSLHMHFPSCVFAHRLRQAETQTPAHLRSLKGGQNIGLLLLLCSCNKRSCRERTLGLDQIKTSAPLESVAASAGRGPFSLTLNRDLKGGAVTLVFCRHLTPVAPSISGDHFDDLHFVRIDLGEKILITA